MWSKYVLSSSYCHDVWVVYFISQKYWNGACAVYSIGSAIFLRICVYKVIAKVYVLCLYISCDSCYSQLLGVAMKAMSTVPQRQQMLSRVLHIHPLAIIWNRGTHVTQVLLMRTTRLWILLSAHVIIGISQERPHWVTVQVGVYIVIAIKSLCSWDNLLQYDTI